MIVQVIRVTSALFQDLKATRSSIGECEFQLVGQDSADIHHEGGGTFIGVT